MYRLLDLSSSPSATDVFHFLVSNLIHKGGWSIVDASDGAIELSAWPEPHEAAPVLVAGAYLVTQAPDAAAASAGDVIQIRYDPAGPIEVVAARLSGGTGSPYDMSVAYVAGATDTRYVAGTAYLPGGGVLTAYAMSLVGADRLLVFSSGSGLVLAALDTSADTVKDGVYMGYADTAVLRGSTTTPSLGAGDDPFPLLIFTIGTTGAPPLLASAFGSTAYLYEEDDSVVSAEPVVQFYSTASHEMISESLPYGGGVPVHVLANTLIMHLPAVGNSYLRGVCPNVFLTSRTVSLSVLEITADDSQYLVLGTNVAVGPL